MTTKNSDARVKVLNFPTGVGEEPIRVVVVGGGGPSGGTVDQGDPGVAPWLVLDQSTLDAIIALGGLFGAAVPDADDQAPTDLLSEFARLMLYDDVGGNWDRARVRFGGLEARDDYADVAITHMTTAVDTPESVALPVDTRLVRVTNWSTTVRPLVRFDAPVVDLADPAAARVGVAPVNNLSNSELWPVRQSTVHLRAASAIEVTVEAFRGP